MAWIFKRVAWWLAPILWAAFRRRWKGRHNVA
jgi:hypothetical protein